MNTSYDYSADLPAPAGDNVLAVLGGLARDAVQAKQGVVDAEEALRAAKERLRHITTVLLPEAMDNAHQQSCRTSDGLSLKLKEVLRASIPRDREPAALQWLRDNGCASIIKNVVSLSFGRGEEGLAQRAVDILHTELTRDADRRESVHPQTLQANLRELIAGGVDVPLETFGAIVQREVEVK